MTLPRQFRAHADPHTWTPALSCACPPEALEGPPSDLGGRAAGKGGEMRLARTFGMAAIAALGALSVLGVGVAAGEGVRDHAKLSLRDHRKL